MALRVEEHQGMADDTAATDLLMMCKGGAMLEGNGVCWGTLSVLHTCPPGQSLTSPPTVVLFKWVLRCSLSFTIIFYFHGLSTTKENMTHKYCSARKTEIDHNTTF